jgi:hypothetical protein
VKQDYSCDGGGGGEWEARVGVVVTQDYFLMPSCFGPLVG